MAVMSSSPPDRTATDQKAAPLPSTAGMADLDINGYAPLPSHSVGLTALVSPLLLFIRIDRVSLTGSPPMWNTMSTL